MASTGTTQTISTAELAARIARNDNLHLVNVLTEEWVARTRGARIPGSHWIPVDEAEKRFPLLFGKDEAIVVYCGGPQCPSSGQAFEKLQAIGFRNVLAYEGGLKEWQEAGHTLISADAAPESGACSCA